MSELSVRNLKKSYNGSPVLKGIDFDLEKGEILSIIGASGNGKTTLLRCLNFLETPDAGNISVGGEEVFSAENQKKLSSAERQARQLKFGLVFQSFNLFPQYTVKKNLTLAPLLRAKAEWKKTKTGREEKSAALREIEGRAQTLLERVGLADKAEEYPSVLSGGQQQRVAIARALMLSPRILCFDEPTSALDPELTGEVLKVIRGLKDNEHTMIIVTHELNFARSVSDKVLFMADGKIEEFGTPEKVFDHPKSDKMRAFLAVEKQDI